MCNSAATSNRAQLILDPYPSIVDPSNSQRFAMDPAVSYVSETKDHSRSPCPQKYVHNFSLEGLTISLPASFSCNYPSHSFLCMSHFIPLLHY